MVVSLRLFATRVGRSYQRLDLSGYAERFYDDRSFKLIYLTPRSVSGFYGAVSYTPSTDISSGFDLAGATRTPASRFRRQRQSRRFSATSSRPPWFGTPTDTVDLSTGLTYSYAKGTAGRHQTPNGSRSNSLSGAISATF